MMQRATVLFVSARHVVLARRSFSHERPRAANDNRAPYTFYMQHFLVWATVLASGYGLWRWLW